MTFSGSGFNHINVVQQNVDFGPTFCGHELRSIHRSVIFMYLDSGNYHPTHPWERSRNLHSVQLHIWGHLKPDATFQSTTVGSESKLQNQRLWVYYFQSQSRRESGYVSDPSCRLSSSTFPSIILFCSVKLSSVKSKTETGQTFTASLTLVNLFQSVQLCFLAMCKFR